VTLLCDVRRHPLSRKYGFSKSVLSEACKKVGIGYEHLPDLGIASSERRNISGKEDDAELFVAYRKHSLPKNQAALDQIQSWIIKGKQRVALTCSNVTLFSATGTALLTPSPNGPIKDLLRCTSLEMPAERILITVKTYPTLSRKHGELVCTAGASRGWNLDANLSHSFSSARIPESIQ